MFSAEGGAALACQRTAALRRSRLSAVFLVLFPAPATPVTVSAAFSNPSMYSARHAGAVLAILVTRLGQSSRGRRRGSQGGHSRTIPIEPVRVRHDEQGGPWLIKSNCCWV